VTSEPDNQGGSSKVGPETQPGSSIAVWIPIGVGLGVPLGLVFDNLALGIAVGAAIGSAIGAVMDRRRTGLESEHDGKHRGRLELVIGIGVLSLLVVVAALVFLLLWS
jgi:hypothetical protein